MLSLLIGYCTASYIAIGFIILHDRKKRIDGIDVVLFVLSPLMLIVVIGVAIKLYIDDKTIVENYVHLKNK